MLYCPNHPDTHRPNLAVYPDGTYCFRCGFRESAQAFLERIRQHPEQAKVPRQYRYRSSRASYKRVDWPLKVQTWHRNLLTGSRQDRLDYLIQERCLSRQIITEQRLGHDGSRFVIPYWEGDRPVGVKFRADPAFPIEGYPRYVNSPGLAALYDPVPEASLVIVTEGELDALILAQYQIRAVTAPNGSQGMINKILRARLPWSGVLIATDWDEPGEHAAQAMLALRPAWIRAEKPWTGDGKDLTDWIRSLPPARRGSSIRRWLQEQRARG